MRNLITIRGQWMYDTAAVSGLVGLIRGGMVDLEHWSVTEFSLAGVNDAVTHAAVAAGPFRLTVLKPSLPG